MDFRPNCWFIIFLNLLRFVSSFNASDSKFYIFGLRCRRLFIPYLEVLIILPSIFEGLCVESFVFWKSLFIKIGFKLFKVLNTSRLSYIVTFYKYASMWSRCYHNRGEEFSERILVFFQFLFLILMNIWNMCVCSSYLYWLYHLKNKVNWGRPQLDNLILSEKGFWSVNYTFLTWTKWYRYLSFPFLKGYHWFKFQLFISYMEDEFL